MKRSTIKDVARLAEVSPSTVSFVINNTKGQTISEETRSRILECAKRLNYRPHYSAARIRSGSARTIAVLSTYRREALYFLDMINGIVSETSASGYGLILCANNRDPEPRQCLDYFQEGRIDGVVFISSAHSEEASMEAQYIAYFRKNRIPFTIVYGYTHEEGVCYSNADFYTDGYNAASILIQRGCKSIHYIGALDKYNAAPYLPQTEQARLAGYRGALAANGLAQTSSFFPRNFNALDFQDEIQRTINARHDGYVVCWATLGLQLMERLRSVGLRIPEDTRVIATDTLPYLDCTTPALSALRIPFEEMAAYATRSLIHILEGDAVLPQSKCFAGIAEIRQSI